MTPQALLVGGTRRVGRWCSTALLAAGWRVHAVYRTDTAAALQFAATAQAQGWDLRVYQADALADGALAQVVDAACGTGEPLDALVYATGPAVQGPLLGTRPAEARRVWEGNVLAVHQAVLACEARLLSPGGRIVAFLSAGADMPRAFRQVPWYAASKAMLASYLRSLARELAPRGITANCLSLGITELPPEGAPAPPAADLPGGRYVGERDVAAALTYLLSPAADQLTGTVLNLGGAFGL